MTVWCEDWLPQSLVELAQRQLLPVLVIEVPGVEPALEVVSNRGPLAVQNGVVRGVAAMSFWDDVVVKDTLKTKAKS